ncbi:hypothetical protein [Citricoccus alkalitolerans]|uniref:hypothetical protein n=1 Tax=Citricoccus alkalitolerans TaxID=246603 RepID=UPI0031D0587A
MARRARDGQLVRLARGTYCALETWLRSAPWDRHLLAVVAHAASRNRDVVFCHQTAAVLHGLPSADTLDVIHTRATSRGGSGCSPARNPYVNVDAASRLVGSLRAEGLKLARRTLPGLPVTRALWNIPPSLLQTSPEFGVVPVHLSDGRFIGHVLADSVPWACAAAFSSGSLIDTISMSDHLLRHRPDEFAATATLIEDLALSRAAHRRACLTMSFADPRSESPKESASRALIYQLGFEVPDLQYQVLDATGREVARTDFKWRRSTLRARILLGEFDGLMKYGAALAGPNGGDDALAREKKRELMLARLGYDVVRWIDSDLKNPRAFGRMLAEHGVPLR